MNEGKSLKKKGKKRKKYCLKERRNDKENKKI